MPAAKADVVKVATPPLSVLVPMELPPSRNVTVPVGVPVAGANAVIVAVKVTDCPKSEGFCDEVTTVVVSALLTTCGFPVKDPVLALKHPSPP